MNEQAQELVNQAGEKVLAYLEATEGFAMEQAPLLAQEIVRYGIWWHVAMATLCFTILVPFGYAAQKATRWAWKEDAPEVGVPTVMIGISAVLGLGTAIAINLSIALKVFLAPRLYILEQIGGLF